MAAVPLRAETPQRDPVLSAEPEQKRPLAQRTILISLRKQRLRLLDGTNEVATSRVSSGQPGFDTPTGIFSILEKSVYHESNIYEGAPMPFMQRITWSGIAMHAGVVPGYRASHGCIRLPYSFAKAFFEKTGVGGRVIITQDEVNPVPFEHPNLFKPLPENDPARAQRASVHEPRVAVNDISSADKGALTNLIAVTPALADEAKPTTASDPSAAPPKPRSRAEALRMQSEKMQKLQEELKSAEARKIITAEKAKAALRAADDAEARLKSVRQPFEGVLKAATAAEAARNAAAAAFRNALLAPPALRDPKGRAQAEDKELDLEDRILDATAELARAKAGSAQAELAVAEAKVAFQTADAAKVKAVDEVPTSVAALRSAQTALIEAQKAAQRRDRPLSIFIGLKSQRIFVRQGFEAVLESPIAVDDPPGAIGTHVLTAVDYDKTGNGFNWQLVTAQQPRPYVAQDNGESRSKKNKKEPSPATPSTPLNIEAANVALDAIRVPQDVQDMIAELARPGTSLIISERDLSGETGKGTEFVVLTKQQ